MGYSHLRGSDCRPQTIHMTETPNESPCRTCEYWNQDKNEFPNCINCLKINTFKTIPVNLHYQHDIHDTPKRSYPKNRKSSNTIPSDAKCTVPGCDKPARYKFFKDKYNDLICHNHYLRFYRRYRRNGVITDAKGDL
jgi:hypothetical protein